MKPTESTLQNRLLKTIFGNPVLGDLRKLSQLRHSPAREMVARTGIEPATQGFSDLENRFFLLPLIELNQPRWPNSIGESRFFPGNFSNPKQSKAMLGNWQLR